MQLLVLRFTRRRRFRGAFGSDVTRLYRIENGNIDRMGEIVLLVLLEFGWYLIPRVTLL